MSESADAWRSWPQERLEREYNARATVPDVDLELHKYREHSAHSYSKLTCLQGLRYGEGADEALDLFPVPGRPDAPLFLFIHGGYWRALSRRDSVFMARNLTELGIAVAALDYSLAPGARLDHMVGQCCRAVNWLYEEASRLKVGCRRRFIIGGSSAGAHLAAMVLSRQARTAGALPAHLIQGGVLVSGLYNLLPVQACLPNSWLNLSIAEARALSPRHEPLPGLSTQLHIVWAETDTNEFKRQSRDYVSACIANGNSVVSYEVPGRNHFDVILDWMHPASRLTKSVLELAT